MTEHLIPTLRTSIANAYARTMQQLNLFALKTSNARQKLITQTRTLITGIITALHTNIIAPTAKFPSYLREKWVASVPPARQIITAHLNTLTSIFHPLVEKCSKCATTLKTFTIRLKERCTTSIIPALCALYTSLRTWLTRRLIALRTHTPIVIGKAFHYLKTQ